jgi:hypothetical protein
VPLNTAGNIVGKQVCAVCLLSRLLHTSLTCEGAEDDAEGDPEDVEDVVRYEPPTPAIVMPAAIRSFCLPTAATVLTLSSLPDFGALPMFPVDCKLLFPTCVLDSADKPQKKWVMQLTVLHSQCTLANRSNCRECWGGSLGLPYPSSFC